MERVCIRVRDWQFSAWHLWSVDADQAGGPWGDSWLRGGHQEALPAPREAGAPVPSSPRALPTFPLPWPRLFGGLSCCPPQHLSTGQDCLLLLLAGGPSLPKPSHAGLPRPSAP